LCYVEGSSITVLKLLKRTCCSGATKSLSVDSEVSFSPVNAGSKLFISLSPFTLGINGGSIFFCFNNSQSIELKKG